MVDAALRARCCLFAFAVFAALVGAAAAQQPRVRGGANPVRLDVFVAKDGAPVQDLTAADFEVIEDTTAQAIATFELVRPPAAPSGGAGSPRVFVLFLDTPHLQMSGTYRADTPLTAMLDRVVGADDLVGVMTPDMTARNMTLSPRTATIGEMLRTSWAWGDRSRGAPADSRESDLRTCYPDAFSMAGLAEAVIAKRREQKTLRSLADLVQHLEQVRDERTAVLLLTEGWMLGTADEQLARPVTATTATPACERERSLVALADLKMELRLLTQRANRANVSVYPVDARGLVTADGTAGASAAGPPTTAAVTAARRASLATLAADTDAAPIDGAALEQAAMRLATDTGAYYLLGFASSNPKADGAYRRLTVRVRRPGVTVRTRAGYLAPSAAEVEPPPSPRPVTSTTATPPMSAPTRPSSASRGVGDALARLPVSRRPLALHVQAAGGQGVVRLVVEFDRTTIAAPEWSRGGALLVDLEPADGTGGPRRTSRTEVAAGDRIHALALPEGELLRPGRYQVRVQATPEGGRSPLTITAPVDIPGPTALIGSAVVATRRGPGTGRTYEPTADVRFRRTERLALEIAKLAPEAQLTGRLMNTAGQVLQVPVVVTERAEPSGPPTFVADVMLAPLAAGEYVIELSATAGDKTETRSFALRMVP